ncbi:MAG TPA: diphosphomevalonate decarboxylase, partial [Woeseiaceae bacterium]|nr:diphosphomevalonate decarboxylase [Woeseiaceae bacterium]
MLYLPDRSLVAYTSRWKKPMRALAQAQPNIALVKYWGKRDIERNLPATGSLSVTLAALWTRTFVEFDSSAESDHLSVDGREAPEMLPRVSRCLDDVAGPARQRARVVSESNFPVGAGLASSASAFAALVVAASRAAGRSDDALTLARVAGASSGSAARSLFDGIVELDCGEDAISVHSIASQREWPLEVVIAITDWNAKAVGSTEAMLRCAETSPFYRYWLDRQPGDLEAARRAVAARDFEALADIAEHNCLKMHSLLWTSRPPVVYWNPATIG